MHGWLGYRSLAFSTGILNKQGEAAHMLSGDKNKPSSALKPASSNVRHLIVISTNEKKVVLYRERISQDASL